MKRKIEHEGSEGSISDRAELSGSEDFGELVASESSNYTAPGEVAAVGVVTSPTFSSLFSVTPSISTCSARTSVASAREEKNARRRHRRRLARIVTEQWKYAARARLLALKFYKALAVKLGRSVFLEWKDYTKEKLLILKKVEDLFPLAFSRRYFLLWMNFTVWSKKVQTGLVQFTQSSSVARSRRALKAWREYTNARIMHMKRMATADHYYRVSCLSRCFSDWRLGRQVHQKKEFFRKVAHAKWSFTTQRSALRAWKYFLAWKFEKDMAAERWKKRTLAKCLHRWHSKRKLLLDSDYDSSVDSVMEKAQNEMFSLVVDRHFNERRRRHAFAHWLEIAKSWREVRLSVESFYEGIVLVRLLKNSFAFWLEYSHLRKLLKEQRTVATIHWETHTLRRCLKWWTEYGSLKASRRRREVLALVHWKADKLRKCVLRWMEHCYSRKSRLGKLVMASDSWKARRLRICFDRWCRFTLELHRKQELEGQASDGRMKMLARRVLGTLARRQEKRKLLQQQFRELKSRLECFKLENALKRLRALPRKCSLKRLKHAKAGEFRRAHQARSVLRAWNALHQEQTTQSVSNQQQAVMFYTRLLQRLAFLGWFQVQKQKPPSRESQTPQPREQPLKKCNNILRDPAVKHGARLRPAPRRPTFVLDDHRRQSLPSQSPVFDTSSLSGKSYGARDLLPLLPSTKLEDELSRRFLKDTVTSELPSRTITATTSPSRAYEDYIYHMDSETSDFSHAIADEVAWMEHLLASFDDLRVELVEKRAELALLVEKNGPGCRDKMQTLAQKIALLQQRRAIMLPTIQAVASIIPSLRSKSRKVCDTRVISKS